MGLASIVVLGVLGLGVLVLVAGVIDGEWELRQHRNKERKRATDVEKPIKNERAEYKEVV